MQDENNSPVSGSNSIFNSGFNGTFSCPTCNNDTSGLTSRTDGYDWPESKYYDLYKHNTDSNDYHQRILGDATGEMGPFNEITYNYDIYSATKVISSWYGDIGSFFDERMPYLIRSGHRHDGKDSGVFSFYLAYGCAIYYASFRLVLTP